MNNQIKMYTILVLSAVLTISLGIGLSDSHAKYIKTFEVTKTLNITVGEASPTQLYNDTSNELEAFTKRYPGKLSDDGKSTIEKAFANDIDIQNIEFPDGFETLNPYTFENCASLTSVTLPASLIELGIGSFNGCTSLSTITFKGTKEEWKHLIENYNQAWHQDVPVTYVSCANGYIGIDGDDVIISTFMIDDQTFNFIEGMTWSEWLATDFNHLNLTSTISPIDNNESVISQYDHLETTNNKYLTLKNDSENETSQYIKITETIETNQAYVLYPKQ